jgi:ketosteroid isomerase-like protein
MGTSFTLNIVPHRPSGRVQPAPPDAHLSQKVRGQSGTTLEPGSASALEVTNLLSVGDQIIAEWTSRATARGGATYHNRNIGIFTVRDGKIAAVREYTEHTAQVLL